MSVTFDSLADCTSANLTVLTAPDAYSYNDIGLDVVQTSITTIKAGSGCSFSISLPDLSVAVLETEANGGSGHGAGSGGNPAGSPWGGRGQEWQQAWKNARKNGLGKGWSHGWRELPEGTEEGKALQASRYRQFKA